MPTPRSRFNSSFGCRAVWHFFVFVAGEIGEPMFDFETLISPVVVRAVSGLSLSSRGLDAVPDNRICQLVTGPVQSLSVPRGELSEPSLQDALCQLVPEADRRGKAQKVDERCSGPRVTNVETRAVCSSFAPGSRSGQPFRKKAIFRLEGRGLQLSFAAPQFLLRSGLPSALRLPSRTRTDPPPRHSGRARRS